MFLVRSFSIGRRWLHYRLPLMLLGNGNKSWLVSYEASFQNNSYTKYMCVDEEISFPYLVSSFVDNNLSILN